MFQSRRQYPETQKEERGLARAPGQPAAGLSCWDDMQRPKPSRAARWPPFPPTPMATHRSPHCSFPSRSDIHRAGWLGPFTGMQAQVFPAALISVFLASRT